MKPADKYIFYLLQAIAMQLFMRLFRVLNVDNASAIGGWLGRRIGPATKAHRIAERNLRAAMPHLNHLQYIQILNGMWDNIGRTIAEYPHLETLISDPQRVELVDPDGHAQSLHDDGIGAILIGMHFGNWELSTAPSVRIGFSQYNFYRAPNNPFAEQLLLKLRAPLRQDGFLKKGAEGARKALILLKNGSHIGMLVDQKQNEGIPVPFFGLEAMTTTAPAALARRFGLPIMADCVVRVQGAKFRIYLASVAVANTLDRKADVIETTKRINRRLETWIRENPEQWFWVHRRWPG